MNLLARNLALVAVVLAACTAAAQSPADPPLRPGDYIVAVVNQELVTAFELSQRMGQAREQARRNNQRLPAEREFRTMILESLVEDRAVLSHARDSGLRIDDAEIDRAVAVIASQNQLTMPQLRARLAQDGLDMPRFRAQLKDQLLVERVREREVAQRIRITDGEVDDFIEKQRGAVAGEVQYNVAQILIRVPEGASESVVAERRTRAELAAQRVRAGEDFAAVARQLSEDDNRDRGGEKPGDPEIRRHRRPLLLRSFATTPIGLRRNRTMGSDENMYP